MAALPFAVIAYSSNSKGFEAKLVAGENNRKWQGQAPGSHEFVMIQLVRPTIIGKLVVQNNNSAIFSVEACEQRDAQEKSKWHVLLGTSSLMKPSEAREGTNGTNSFTFTKFKDDAKDGLWHCLKFNVFQPFNKTLPCGLSSIHVYSADTTQTKNSQTRRTPSPNSADENDMSIDSVAAGHDALRSSRARGIRSLIATGKPSNASRATAHAEINEDDDDIVELSPDKQKHSTYRAPVKASLLSKPVVHRPIAHDETGSRRNASNKSHSQAGSTHNVRRGSRGSSSEEEKDDAGSHSSRRGRGRKAGTKDFSNDFNGSLPTTSARQTRASSRQSNTSMQSADGDKTGGTKSVRKTSPRSKKAAAEEAEEMDANGGDAGTGSTTAHNAKKRRATSPKRGTGGSSRHASRSPEPEADDTTKRSDHLQIKGYLQAKRTGGSSSAAAGARGAPRVSPLRDDDVEKTWSGHRLRSEKPFAKIMDDVVFSLSGFVNPERGQLRSDAVQMGARYKPDWTDDCNYLICAFPDTPKFDEATACNAHIVKKHWITECHRQRKLLPWRQYRLYGYENAVDDEKVDDAVIRDSAADIAEDEKTGRRNNNRRGAAATASSSRGRRGAGTSSIRNQNAEDGEEDEADETAAVLALLTGDDEDEDQDYVPGKDEAEAAEEEELEDAETAPDPRDVAKEEAEADAEIEPEDDDDDDDDFLDDDEVA